MNDVCPGSRYRRRFQTAVGLNTGCSKAKGALNFPEHTDQGSASSEVRLTRDFEIVRAGSVRRKGKRGTGSVANEENRCTGCIGEVNSLRKRHCGLSEKQGPRDTGK